MPVQPQENAKLRHTSRSGPAARKLQWASAAFLGSLPIFGESPLVVLSRLLGLRRGPATRLGEEKSSRSSMIAWTLLSKGDEGE
jgi:hypothetical protein